MLSSRSIRVVEILPEYSSRRRSNDRINTRLLDMEWTQTGRRNTRGDLSFLSGGWRILF